MLPVRGRSASRAFDAVSHATRPPGVAEAPHPRECLRAPDRLLVTNRRTRMTRSPGATALIAWLVLLAPIGAAAQQTSTLQLAPCTLPGVSASVKARCGTLQVPENRGVKDGRMVQLRVVVLPATGPERAPDPIFFIAGGPGSSVVEDAGGIARDPAGLRERRDFVLVDQRGTGGSHPIACLFYEPPD